MWGRLFEAEVRKLNKKLLRWVLRTVLLCLAGICLAAIGIYAALETRPVQDRVLRVATRIIEDRTQTRCHIEKIGGSLISSVLMDGLTLSDPATGTPLIAVKRLEIRYSAPMLLGRVLWINRMRMEGGSVHLMMGADGNWRLPAFASGTGFRDKHVAI